MNQVVPCRLLLVYGDGSLSLELNKCLYFVCFIPAFSSRVHGWSLDLFSSWGSTIFFFFWFFQKFSVAS